MSTLSYGKGVFTILKSDKRTPIALITGSSGGFGMVTAIALAERGYHVIATMRDVSKRTALLALAKSKQVLERISVYHLDVTSEGSIQKTISTIIAEYQHIDLLINNAGYAQGGFIEEVPLETWRQQLETNVIGTIAVTQAVLPHMRRDLSGTIVNISSISGKIAFPGYAPYATSKFAIEGFTEALRLEMKPFGVNVVLIEPGSYATDIWNKGFSNMVTYDHSPYHQYLQQVVNYTRRTANSSRNPDEVAQLIVNIAKMKKPKLRYAIGKGTRLTIIAKSLLPWRLIEKLVLKALYR